jgi:hypothetical protein
MKHYYFKTREFGVSDTGIHFLRSGFNYRTISFSEIDGLRIERGKELHNWIVIFFIGAVILLAEVYLSLRIVDVLINGDIGPQNARLALVLFIPFVGAYFVYNSVQTGIILRINYQRYKTTKFPLREIMKEKRLNEFKSLMGDKLTTKFKVAV